jgi:predicted PurR-regulated permease PerM
MAARKRSTTMLRSLVGAAAFCVVVAGLRAAAEIIVLLLIAVVISVICMPSLTWLRRRGLPMSLAISLILLCVATVALAVPLFVGASLRDFLGHFHEYQLQLRSSEREVIEYLNKQGLEVPAGSLLDWNETLAGRALLETTLKEIALSFAKAFIILFLVAFMLAEAAHFHRKAAAAFSRSMGIRRIEEIIENIWRYLSIKTFVSILTGIAVAVLLTILGVEYPLLWGFMAFAFNYVPNVGSIVAAIPAVVLALLESGVGLAVAVAIGYLVINSLLGNILEPRWQGQGLGLSPLVVFVSLLFWGWVLGPVGMLLSAPLTVAVKIACQNFPDTEWIAILLGPKLPDDKPA